MKHDMKITLILVLFFILSQYIGLFITSQYITVEKVIDISTGKESYNVTNVSELPLGIERIEVSEDFSWVWIMVAVLFGTVLVLLLVKFKQRRVWRFWYFFSLVMIMTFALNPFMGNIPMTHIPIALLVSIVLAIFKTYRPNFVIHNITELFLYGGLAAMLVPIMSIYSVYMLLIIISIYDAIAVWKSKHMITLAKFQSDSNLFAGFFIPYVSKDSGDSKEGKSKIIMKTNPADSKMKSAKTLKKMQKDAPLVSRAILGGGDIAFPLIFSGVIMKTTGFAGAALIPPFTALALFFLLYKSEKGKFYPAMPFISAGCFIGALVVGILF